MNRTTVHLLRHGKVHNPDKILYGRLPGYHLSESGRAMADGIADHLAARRPHLPGGLVAGPGPGDGRARRPRRSACRSSPTTGSSRRPTMFEGMRVAVGDGALRRPQHWAKLRNPVRPSWGEPYLDDRAPDARCGLHRRRSAPTATRPCWSSHQLPIWTVRRYLRGSPALAQPDQAAMRAGVADLAALRRRGVRRVALHRAGRRTSPLRRRRRRAAPGRRMRRARPNGRPGGWCWPSRRPDCPAARTGNDAAVYGGSFTFVSPGGKTELQLSGGRAQDRRRPLRTEPGRGRHGVDRRLLRTASWC